MHCFLWSCWVHAPLGIESLLDGGVITAVGGHRELMAREPGYANLMSMEEVAR